MYVSIYLVQNEITGFVHLWKLWAVPAVLANFIRCHILGKKLNLCETCCVAYKIVFCYGLENRF